MSMKRTVVAVFGVMVAFAGGAPGVAAAAGEEAGPVAVAVAGTSGQCKVVSNKVFAGDHETVRLARTDGLPEGANFAMFVAPLAVNTDGAPTSYHPRDFLGTSLAINRIDNGIAIRRIGGGPKLTTTEKIAAFERWRDAGWVAPAGIRLGWKNVIAADPAGKPCVFSGGANKGYFGSLTALTNGLSAAQAGECRAADQLDQRFIPAIVLRGDGNPLKGFGAATGDLVLAFSPTIGKAVAAVIGDTGDGDRIGEGSVALNMALLGKSDQPRTYPEAKKLDTGTKSMAIAVLPKTVKYKRVLPYTAANIAGRVDAWAKDNGYGSIAGLAMAMKGCAQGL